MPTLFSLDNRLLLCADFVRQNAKLADIGTDHAYLPVHLAVSGRISSAIASDINSGPLQKGRSTVEKYHAEELITLRLCDGLCGIAPDEADDIVIAGMGGETIIGIISETRWLKDKTKHLILQPMTKAEKLIEHLYENGFEIIEQKTCEADKKLYTAMLAAYTGQTDGCDELFTYCGKIDCKGSDTDIRYLKARAAELMKRSRSDIKYRRLAKMIKERINER